MATRIGSVSFFALTIALGWSGALAQSPDVEDEVEDEVENEVKEDNSGKG